MLIGTPKEIKNHEYRVGLSPSSVRELITEGHQVLIETGAGAGIGIQDADYVKAGASIATSAAEVFAKAEMIVKVKEPQAAECALLREGQILFTYLHLAADLAQAEMIRASGCIAIAYETVTNRFGHLPLLSPMSEVAGRMSIQAGAHCLEKEKGGAGILLGGVPGVPAANVLVLGGGVVGTNAIRMAMGAEASVTVIEKSLERLKELDLQFGSKIRTVYATTESIEKYATDADLIIGAVLVPGAAAPRLLTRNMLTRMRPGSVVVDVAIDQGGCFETSRPTTHADPTYVEEGVVHYCVTNMPGAVPLTSTYALNNATLPFILALARKGYRQALLDDAHLCNGLNVMAGQVTHKAVAEALNMPYTSALELLAGTADLSNLQKAA
jgi:alanine dehydrogenase